MPTAYIGLGANLGAADQTIARAVEALDRMPDIAVTGCSSLYRSAAMVLSPTERQPDYINAVARLDTLLTPMPLLRRLQGLERRFGRLRTGRRWAARQLDLDLLLYGKQRVSLPRLAVPHPGIAERAFVLLPLAEIAPEGLIVPGYGPLDALLERLTDNSNYSACTKICP